MTDGPFWHGGGRVPGELLLPGEQTSVSRSDDEGVFVTTARVLAETYASTVDEPTAWIYRVEPIGALTPIPSLIPDSPTISFRCERALILARFTLANDRRRHLRAAVRKAMGVIDRRHLAAAVDAAMEGIDR